MQIDTCIFLGEPWGRAISQTYVVAWLLQAISECILRIPRTISLQTQSTVAVRSDENSHLAASVVENRNNLVRVCARCLVFLVSASC